MIITQKLSLYCKLNGELMVPPVTVLIRFITLKSFYDTLKLIYSVQLYIKPNSWRPLPDTSSTTFPFLANADQGQGRSLTAAEAGVDRQRKLSEKQNTVAQNTDSSSMG